LSTMNTQEKLPYLLLGASAALLLGAYGFEFLGGLAPCQLCYYQRIPHGVAVVLCAIVLLRPARRREILALLSLVYAISTALGVHHAGIEWQWWPGPASCSAAGGWGGASATLEELMAQLSAAPVVRCDAAPWTLFGLSLAGYNTLFSFGLLALSVAGLKQTTGNKGSPDAAP
jgi:disulfide bond formation protein DsbB